jgi:capsular exopolysaccharide synthesis family protein
MSRFADALKRARTGSITGSASDEDRGGEAIRFFAPGQPAIVAPWNVGRDQAGTPAAAQPTARFLQDRRPAAGAGTERDQAEEPRRIVPFQATDKLVVSPEVTSLVRDQYNKLATALHQLQLERGIKVVMITSAVPREGKTLTTANLALTLSESYERRVLLIDADLRRPTIHSVFGISNVRGLSDSLTAHGPLPCAHLRSTLSILTAGRASRDPMKTLTSDRMRSLVDDARAEFDWVLLDTAPIGLLPDASVLASMADGTLFVTRAGSTGYDAVQRATEVVGADRILGIVLNGLAEEALPVDYHEYYSAGLEG